jgi:uncharacterized protein YndB with AHSA1/START domain
MPIKKDESGKRWVEMTFVTPGTPEQVWHAMATGAGNAAWFTKATIEERVGGTLQFHFGPGMTSSGEVTRWEPPRCFGYIEREWSQGAPPIATEITITSRSGGQCVVRMVHSLFSSTDDWDDQMESFESGWPGFFEVLRIYLANYPGMKGSSFQAMTGVQGEPLTVWTRLVDKLNLAGANVGEERATPTPEELVGIVERIQQDSKIRAITLRLNAPSPGVAVIAIYASGKLINASVSGFFYGDDAEAIAGASSKTWQEWVAKNLSET